MYLTISISLHCITFICVHVKFCSLNFIQLINNIYMLLKLICSKRFLFDVCAAVNVYNFNLFVYYSLYT